MIWVVRLILTMAFIGTAMVGGYVIIRDARDKVHRLFGLIALSALGWMFTSLVHAWDPDHLFHSPPLWGPAGGFFSTWVIPIAVHFVLHFPKPLRPVRGWHLALLYVPTTFLAFSWLTGGMVDYSGWPDEGGRPTRLSSALVVWIALLVPSSIALMLLKLRRIKHAVERNQMKTVIIGFSLSASLCLTTAGILPLLGFNALSPVSSAFFLIWIECTAFAIVRFGLFHSAVTKVRSRSLSHKLQVSLGLIIVVLFFSVQFPLIVYLTPGDQPFEWWWQMGLLVLGAQVLQGLLIGLAFWKLRLR